MTTAKDGACVIETPRLLLRPPAIADFSALAAIWAKPEAAAFIGGAPSTREDSWARLLRYLGHWAACGHGFFAITERTTGRYLGECGIADFKREMTPSLDGYAEAGWILDPVVWGRGYAREALAAVLSRHDANPGAPPLACIIAHGNHASVRLAQATGFHRLPEDALYRGKPTQLFTRPLA